LIDIAGIVLGIVIVISVVTSIIISIIILKRRKIRQKASTTTVQTQKQRNSTDFSVLDQISSKLKSNITFVWIFVCAKRLTHCFS
jgi:mannitol-specific phosphotransferase system IIBC component